MIHKHHIIPRYEGGSDDDSNIVRLTPTQHAMWHFAEWTRKGKWEDFCGFKMILGDVNSPDLRLARTRWAGQKGGEMTRDLYAGTDYYRNLGKLGVKAQRIKFERESRTVAEKRWIVISPEGKKFEITNMAKFCRENNLCNSKMSGVASGSRNHHKGWKCLKV